MIYSVGTNTEEVIEVEENIIAFEEVQVAVLDCRSGRPLANKKVKRIVVKQDDVAIIDVEFDRTVDHTLTVELADALKRLGFDDADVKKGYKKYWEARDSSAKAADAAGEPFPVFEARVIDEYKRHRATDDNGILTIQLPRVIFNGHSISVEVGFWDFPVFLEAVNDDLRVQDLAPQPIRRDGVDIGGSRLLLDLGNNGTRFDIVWTGREQSTDWNGNWGWEARRVSRNAAPIAPASGGMVSTTYFLNSIGLNSGAGNQEVDMATEFKVAETIILKNNQAEVNMKAAQNVSILDSSLFSMFYVKGTNNSPFVLYGMEWCQPVWDGIEDPQGELVAGSSNENVYIQNPEYAHLNMHVVTYCNDLGGVDDNGGKGYGLMEACRTGWSSRYRSSSGSFPGHAGYDLYVVIGDPVFALRGADAVPQTSGTHYKVRIEWEELAEGAWNTITYLHLSEEDRFEGYAMAGQIIGRGGRSGNLGWSSEWPGHTHLNVGSYPDGPDRYTSRLFETNKAHIDKWNLKLLPTNNFPLLMPCRAQVGNNAQTGRFITCNFDNGSYANQCWAAMELKCPALANRSNAAADEQQIRVIQAQLKFLGYYNGLLDNDAGIGTQTAIAKYKDGSTTGIDSANITFLDGRPRPIPVSNSQEYRINGLTRREAFEDAEEIFFNDNGSLDIERSGEVSDLLLQLLNIEAPF